MMKDGRLPHHWCSSPGGAVSRTSKYAQRLVLNQCDAESSSNSSCEQVQRVGRLRTRDHVQGAMLTRLCDIGDLKEEPFA
eukprot:10044688-Heterocapsa_arctica.AAC.1